MEFPAIGWTLVATQHRKVESILRRLRSGHPSGIIDPVTHEWVTVAPRGGAIPLLGQGQLPIPRAREKLIVACNCPAYQAFSRLTPPEPNWPGKNRGSVAVTRERVKTVVQHDPYPPDGLAAHHSLIVSSRTQPKVLAPQFFQVEWLPPTVVFQLQLALHGQMLLLTTL